MRYPQIFRALTDCQLDPQVLGCHIPILERSSFKGNMGNEGVGVFSSLLHGKK